MWKKAEKIFYAAIALSLLGDVLVAVFKKQDHPEFWYHYLPGFDFMFGLVACILIIKSSKFLAKNFLSRPEDYYD